MSEELEEMDVLCHHPPAHHPSSCHLSNFDRVEERSLGDAKSDVDTKLSI